MLKYSLTAWPICWSLAHRNAIVSYSSLILASSGIIILFSAVDDISVFTNQTHAFKIVYKRPLPLILLVYEDRVITGTLMSNWCRDDVVSSS